MSVEDKRIITREDLERHRPREEWKLPPPTEEIKRRAMEDAKRSLEKFREQMERLARELRR